MNGGKVRVKWILPLIVLILAAAGCRTSGDEPIPVTVTGLVPATRALHLPAFALTVHGGGFSAAASVECDGRPLPTTFVSSGELTGQVGPADIPEQAGGACTIRVRQGVQVSNSLSLAIIADPVFSAPVDVGGTYDRLDERVIVGFKYGLFTAGEGQVMIIAGQLKNYKRLASLRQSGDYGKTFSAPLELQRSDAYDIFDFAVSRIGNIYILENYYNPNSQQNSAWLSTRAAGQSSWESRLLTQDAGTGWMNARYFAAPNGDEYILMPWEAAWVHSIDHGHTWSGPQFFPAQDQFTRGDFLFFAPTGQMVLSWTHWRDNSSSPYQTGSSNISSSTDGGLTWGDSRLLPEASTFSLAEPDSFMVQDENGNFYLFCRRGALEKELRVATSADQGQTWRYLNLPVLGLPEKATLWAIEADGLFNINALFLEWAGEWNKMYILRSCDHGVTWSAPATVSVPAQYAVLGAKMAVDESGVVHLLLRAALKPTQLYGAPAQHLFYCNSR
jgi:hypothetical protein